MHRKIVFADSFRFNEPTTRLVKASSRGLRGDDRHEFLKYASHEFIDHLDELKPGEVPVLNLAVGAFESYGANRNADGFRRHWCEQNHSTFKKYGYVFRDHENKDPRKSYGRIVATAFNPEMDRVELLLGLNGTKEAAERNGGLIADKEVDKIMSGSTYPTSMACKVAYDVCSFCGNKAAKREEYCDTSRVKLASGRMVPACSGFGCVDGLAKVANDGRMQYVDNPNPWWFDLSGVWKNADRISHALGLLEKAASAGRTYGGAELADNIGIVVPPELLLDGPVPAYVTRQIKLAAALAELDDRYVPHAADLAFDRVVFEKLGSVPEGETSQVMRALADARVLLSPADWLHVVLRKEAAVEDVVEIERCLPGVFSRLSESMDLAGSLVSNPYMPGRGEPPIRLQKWAGQLTNSRGIAGHVLAKRASVAAIRGAQIRVTGNSNMIKYAADSSAADTVAQQYAIYQIAFLDACDDSSLATTVVRQNRNRV